VCKGYHEKSNEKKGGGRSISEDGHILREKSLQRNCLVKKVHSIRHEKVGRGEKKELGRSPGCGGGRGGRFSTQEEKVKKKVLRGRES